MSTPRRGEIWLVDFGPVAQTRGREQAKRRPALVLSADDFNWGPMVVVVPVSTTLRNLGYHLRIDPPEGGVTRPGMIQCDQVRSVSRDRLLGAPWGTVGHPTLAEVQETVSLILEF